MDRHELQLKAERFVLGSMLLGYDLPYPKVSENAFLNPSSILLYNAIGKLGSNRRSGVEITNNALSAALSDKLGEDAAALAFWEWVDECRAVARKEVASAEYWLDQFVTAVTRRALASELSKLDLLLSYGNRKDLQSALEGARKRLDRIRAFVAGRKNDVLTANEVSEEALSYLESVWAGKQKPYQVGFPSFPRLQELTGGLDKGSVMSVLADTKAGKTTFAGAVAYELTMQGRGLVVPTELPGKLFYLRMIADAAGVSLVNLMNTKNEEIRERARAAVERLKPYSHNFNVLDGVDQTPQNVLFTVERMLQEPQGCKWLVVDSGTVLAARRKNGTFSEVAATADTANVLQEIATTLGVPVVVTWQIGRKVETRINGKRHPAQFVPRLHDAMWSSAIEQSSSLVFALMRYSMYVDAGLAEPAPDIFPPGALTLHLLASRYTGSQSIGAYIPYFLTSEGLVEGSVESRQLV